MKVADEEYKRLINYEMENILKERRYYKNHAKTPLVSPYKKNGRQQRGKEDHDMETEEEAGKLGAKGQTR